MSTIRRYQRHRSAVTGLHNRRYGNGKHHPLQHRPHSTPGRIRTCVVRIRSAVAWLSPLTDGAHSCLVLAVTFPRFTMFREVWPGVVVTL
jgi:hypothetical protein